MPCANNGSVTLPCIKAASAALWLIGAISAAPRRAQRPADHAQQNAFAQHHHQHTRSGSSLARAACRLACALERAHHHGVIMPIPPMMTASSAMPQAKPCILVTLCCWLAACDDCETVSLGYRRSSLARTVSICRGSLQLDLNYPYLPMLEQQLLRIGQRHDRCCVLEPAAGGIDADDAKAPAGQPHDFAHLELERLGRLLAQQNLAAGQTRRPARLPTSAPRPT